MIKFDGKVVNYWKHRTAKIEDVFFKTEIGQDDFIKIGNFLEKNGYHCDNHIVFELDNHVFVAINDFDLLFGKGIKKDEDDAGDFSLVDKPIFDKDGNGEWTLTAYGVNGDTRHFTSFKDMFDFFETRMTVNCPFSISYNGDTKKKLSKTTDLSNKNVRNAFTNILTRDMNAIDMLRADICLSNSKGEIKYQVEILTPFLNQFNRFLDGENSSDDIYVKARDWRLFNEVALSKQG